MSMCREETKLNHEELRKDFPWKTKSKKIISRGSINIVVKNQTDNH